MLLAAGVESTQHSDRARAGTGGTRGSGKRAAPRGSKKKGRVLGRGEARTRGEARVEAEEHGERHDDGEEGQRHRGARRRHAPPPPLPRRGRGAGRRSRALHPAPPRPARGSGVNWAGGRPELPRSRARRAGRPRRRWRLEGSRGGVLEQAAAAAGPSVHLPLRVPWPRYSCGESPPPLLENYFCAAMRACSHAD